MPDPTVLSDHSGVAVFDLRPVTQPLIKAVDVYSGAARNMTIKVARRVGAGQFDVLASEPFSHPGGGTATAILSTPVDASDGTIRLGYHYASGPAIEVFGGMARAYRAPDADVGSYSDVTEDTGNLASVTCSDVAAQLQCRMVAAILRSSVNGWHIVNDGDHVPVGAFGLEVHPDHLEVFFDKPFVTLSTFNVNVDETLLLSDYAVGASCGLASIDIYIKQIGTPGYVDPYAITNGNANINVMVMGV